jgi:hypothetical protein
LHRSLAGAFTFSVIDEAEELRMVMWFYDEAGELAELQDFRKELRQLEKEYLEIQVLLRDTEQALRADPASEYLKAKVQYLGRRLRDLEKRAPRPSSDVALELALWGTPHA